MPHPWTVIDMIEPREWTDGAACLGTNPELFFPISTAGPALEQTDAAKRICARCAVRTDCLDWALRVGEAHGIWGGTTPEERRYLRAGPADRIPA